MPYKPSTELRSRVLSFDADGSLFHLGYIRGAEADTTQVLKYNAELLAQLKKENSADYGRVIVMVGSARQSWDLDQENMKARTDTDGKQYYTGSFFPAIEAVNTFFETSTLDDFLMADLEENISKGPDSKGSSFARARNPDGKPHASAFIDKSKILLLYVQMHRCALAHPDEEFDFDFFDDKAEILGCVHTFYTEHPWMIPKNVTLRLFKYEGSMPTIPKTPIKGKGRIDNNYSLTVTNLFEQAQQLSGLNARVEGIYITSYVKRIQLPKPQTEPDTSPILIQSSGAEGCSSSAQPVVLDTQQSSVRLFAHSHSEKPELPAQALESSVFPT